MRIRHGELPPSQIKKYEKGWVEHYLKPLAKYFAKGGKAGAAKSPPAKASARAWGRREERKSRRAAPARKAHKPAARKPAARKPAHRPAPRKKTVARKKR